MYTHRWCYKSPPLRPSLLITPSAQNVLHSPLHMYKHCPSFKIYFRKHGCHETSLLPLARCNVFLLPATSLLVAATQSFTLYFSYFCMSSLLWPMRTGSTSDECLSRRALHKVWHTNILRHVNWMTMVFHTQWFHKLFLSPRKYCNAIICFAHTSGLLLSLHFLLLNICCFFFFFFFCLF